MVSLKLHYLERQRVALFSQLAQEETEKNPHKPNPLLMCKDELHALIYW